MHVCSLVQLSYVSHILYLHSKDSPLPLMILTVLAVTGDFLIEVTVITTQIPTSFANLPLCQSNLFHIWILIHAYVWRIAKIRLVHLGFHYVMWIGMLVWRYLVHSDGIPSLDTINACNKDHEMQLDSQHWSGSVASIERRLTERDPKLLEGAGS